MFVQSPALLENYTLTENELLIMCLYSAILLFNRHVKINQISLHIRQYVSKGRS